MTNKSAKYIISLSVTFLAGIIGVLFTAPNIPTWYDNLNLPSFNPPGWLFGPVWTVLYVLMGIGLYLVWTAQSKKSKRLAFVVYGAQLVLNALWCLVFFGLHELVWGGVVIVALLIMIVAGMYLFWPFSRRATCLLIPYALWVSFATVLNFSIVNLNASPGINSYDECAKAKDSVILETYPSICTTKDKQRFTNPHESSRRPG